MTAEKLKHKRACAEERKARLKGIYSRPGFGGYGVQFYRVRGSALGDVEEPMGFGRTLADAIADCTKKGNWPV